MLPVDLTLDSTIACPVGTLGAEVYSQLWPSSSQTGLSRSVSSVATTTPKTLTISHSVRKVKGLKSLANISIAAPDVIFDRHLVRIDRNVANTTWFDPEFKLNASIQIVLEVPRMGTSSPTTNLMASMLLQLTQMLTNTAYANLVRVCNGES